MTDVSPSANRVIDLPKTCSLHDQPKSVEELQLVTPDRHWFSTVRNGLRDAIRAPSFSSTYPDADVQEFLESSLSSQQTVTPSQSDSLTNHGIIHNDVINIYSEEDLNNSNLSSSMVQECDDYKIVNTTVNKWFLSQPYYSSNVILNETHSKIFNYHFVEYSIIWHQTTFFILTCWKHKLMSSMTFSHISIS